MISIYVDGCRKKSGKGGYGYIIQREGRLVIGGGFKDDTTNNVMELTAPIMAIQNVKGRYEFSGIGAIEIFSDSKYFVDGFNSWMAKWQRNGWTKSEGEIKNLELWKSLFQFSLDYSIKATWVRGHNGHKENELCDVIANKCCLSEVMICGDIPDTGRLLGAYSLSQFIVRDAEPKFGKLTRKSEGDETFIRLMPDGRIEIKDGRSLEEYLNHPIQVAKRKELNLGELELCIVSRKFFEDARVPHFA